MKVKLRTFTVVSGASPASISPTAQILTASTRIKALKANTAPVYVGLSDDGCNWELQPGDEIEMTEIFEKDGGSADIDLKEVFVKGVGSICVMYTDRTPAFRS
jgi:hypothetical protein